jgi:hypothetical protein
MQRWRAPDAPPEKSGERLNNGSMIDFQLRDASKIDMYAGVCLQSG